MKKYNVESRDDDWIVKADDSERATAVCSTQSESIDAAEELAKNNKPALVRIRASRTTDNHNAGEWRDVRVYIDDSETTRYFVQKSKSSPSDWEVRKEGAERASTIHATQKAAEAYADELAKKNAPGAVYVRNVGGQWRKVDSYE